jgi:hypothetical protein
VVYHIMCGYVACVLECHGSVCCASQLGSTTDRTTTLRHTGHITTLYDIAPILFVFQVTQKDPRSSLMMAGYCQNM